LTEKEQLTILVIVKLSFICSMGIYQFQGIGRDFDFRRETPAGEACPGETPQAHRRRGGFPETARGKRMPYVPINESLYSPSQT